MFSFLEEDNFAVNQSRMKFIFTLVLSFFALHGMAGIPSNGTTNFNNATPQPVASGPNSGITASDLEGFDFTLIAQPPGATMTIEVWDGSVGTGNGVAFYESTSSINPKFSEILIKSNSSARFDLLSIGINAQSSSNGNAVVTITGLDLSGNPVAGATITGTASVSALTTFDVSSNAAFKGIYSFRITSNDVVYAFLDNISLLNVVSTLPVRWDDFKATKNLSDVQLNWATSFEQNTSNFLIQHSNQQNDWQTIGNVKAAGNSDIKQSYSFLHNYPAKGVNNYRIIQVDLDGKRSISKIVSINIQSISKINISPNPVVSNTLHIRTNETLNIEIIDLSGKTLMTGTTLVPGLNSIDISKFGKGMYFIKAPGQTIQFIKQ
jgi:hypothetical protein